jgi:hypothetical protein
MESLAVGGVAVLSCCTAFARPVQPRVLGVQFSGGFPGPGQSTIGRLSGSPGILAAFAGLIPAALWQVMSDRHTKVKAQREQLDEAAQQFVPAELSGGVTRCLRPEAEIVMFWPRPELAMLRAWAASPLRTDVQLVIGEGGAGKTRLALRLGRELREQYGWRSYWVPAGGSRPGTKLAPSPPRARGRPRPCWSWITRKFGQGSAASWLRSSRRSRRLTVYWQ